MNSSARPLSRTAHAVLGFLTWRPMSGYDVKKAVDGSIRNFWRESYGQIYPILRRLAEAGLAERTGQEGAGGRGRSVYAITQAGREELRRWLGEPVEPVVPRIELLLKLFFGRQLDPEARRRHVREFRAQQVELLERYLGIAEQLRRDLAGHPDLPYWLITLRYGEHERRALIAWADETLVELEGRTA